MTAATNSDLPGRPSPAGQVSESAIGTCPGCKNRLREVALDDGTLARLDGRDPEGEVWARKVDGRWRFRRAGVVGAAPVGVYRYLEHRCPDANMERRVRDLVGGEVIPTAPIGLSPPTLGPCAGGCGKPVTKYGGYPGNPPEMMCAGCKQALADWRADPDRKGGPPFGKWIDGRYVAQGTRDQGPS